MRRGEERALDVQPNGAEVGSPALGRGRRMNRVVWSILTVALSCSAAQSAMAQPRYRLADTSRVRFECVGKKVTHAAKGEFRTIRSYVDVDPNSLGKARGKVDVTLSSVTTADHTWDVFFRAAPFLGLDEFPVATFKLDKLQGARKLAQGQWVKVTLVGRLGVHGIEKPRKFAARVRWTPASAEKPEQIEVESTFQFTWKDHEVLIPSGAAEGFAGDAAKVSVSLVLVR